VAGTAEHRAPAPTGAAAGRRRRGGGGGGHLLSVGAPGGRVAEPARCAGDAALPTGARAGHVLERLAQERRDLEQQVTRDQLQRVRAVRTRLVHRR